MYTTITTTMARQRQQQYERCFICGIRASGYVEIDIGLRDGELWKAPLCNCDYDWIYRKIGYEWHELD